MENQELFIQYKEKPSIKEFILSELNAKHTENNNSSEVEKLLQKNIELEEDYNDMLVTVPLKLLTELYYLRGYRDRIKEESRG